MDEEHLAELIKVGDCRAAKRVVRPRSYENIAEYNGTGSLGRLGGSNIMKNALSGTIGRTGGSSMI